MIMIKNMIKDTLAIRADMNKAVTRVDTTEATGDEAVTRDTDVTRVDTDEVVTRDEAVTTVDTDEVMTRVDMNEEAVTGIDLDKVVMTGMDTDKMDGSVDMDRAVTGMKTEHELGTAEGDMVINFWTIIITSLYTCNLFII